MTPQDHPFLEFLVFPFIFYKKICYLVKLGSYHFRVRLSPNLEIFRALKLLALVYTKVKITDNEDGLQRLKIRVRVVGGADCFNINFFSFG